MRGAYIWIVLVLAAVLCSCRRPEAVPLSSIPEVIPGVGLTNQVIKSGPWSVHIVRLARNSGIELHSRHASNTVMGLSTLTDQLDEIPAQFGKPVAAVNGDFYKRDRTYAGDPRGLQIIEGEVVSAPAGTSVFWTDRSGNPQIGKVKSRFMATWPGGQTTVFGLNEYRTNTAAVLFTPTLGKAGTGTTNGVEYVFEHAGSGPWLPLRVGQTYSARLREIRVEPNTVLESNTMVLSIGPDLASTLPPLQAGAVVKLSTATDPDLTGAMNAISGGPVLVHEGRPAKIDPTELFSEKSYASRSMLEEHPRSAIGWNGDHLVFVGVDGRQQSSVGMSLKHLAHYMRTLGCTEAMNLDGGGSATLWCDGWVVNEPCDGGERPIANSLVATRKKVEARAQ